MTSKPLVLLGNLTCILLTLLGLLQYVSWTIAGALIVVLLSILTLGPLASLSSHPIASHTANKKTGSRTLPSEIRPVREKTQDRQNPKPHPTISKSEPRTAQRNELQRPSPSQLRSELQKAMIPKITPPKTIPTNVSPARPETRSNAPKQEALRPLPSSLGQMGLSQSKPAPPKLDPNTRVLARGDYASFEVKLDRGFEAICEVIASAPVNVYLLNQENLTSLDLGEEFWSETGEEDVARATLNFVAPETGDWFLVVENKESREASATVRINKRPSKSIPNKDSLN